MNIRCYEAAKDQQHKAPYFKDSIFVQSMFQLQLLSSCSVLLQVHLNFLSGSPM